MKTPIYEKGTIKVVWIEDKPDEIYSQMFDNEIDAKHFAKDKKDSLIFSLIQQKNMQEFSWKLLPYGKYKLYSLLFQTYRTYKQNFLRLLTFGH